ncbi:MAG TPA: neuraminidase-like domain-containing protein [Vicinamibacterales bacterium]|nr:neuraminidase-like domain-containing protein [Vicinamibacterales bacterium]
MNLDGRVLSLTQPALVGADVTRLHEALSQLGEAYRQFVQRDVDHAGHRSFGEGTQHAVTAFQEAHRTRMQEVVAGSLDGTAQVRWSGVWGAVDPATAQVIGEEVVKAAEPCVVRGRVEYEDGTPAEGIRVTVHDRDIGAFRQELGGDAEHPTNAGGIFPEVRYPATAYSRGEGRAGPTADLVFDVAHENRSEIVELVAVYRQNGPPWRVEERPITDLIVGFHASPVETVRLVIRRKGDALPSEYERVLAALQPLLIGRTTPDQFDEPRHRDLTFAARETREDRALIETVSQAWALGKATQLAPELFYGLLRHGPPTTVQPMPPDLAALLAFGPRPWEAKLAEAFELRLIPAAMHARLPTWLEQLKHRRTQAALHLRSNEERLTLGELLLHAGVPTDRHDAFAALLTGHDGLAADLWTQVADRLKWTPAEIREVQCVIELSDLASSYKPLVSRLFETEESPSARMLAGWDRRKLEDLVARVGAPADTPGETAEGRQSEYVDDIQSQLRELYPAVYVARVLREVGDPDIRKAGDWLHGVLSQTSSLPQGVPAFDLATTPATGYLRDHGDRLFAHATAAERTHFSSQLKRVQRVFQLSDTPEQMPRLFEERLESAYHIVRWSHEHFVQQYGDRLGGEEATAAVHAKARYIHGTLLNLYLDTRKMYPAREPNIEVPREMHTLAAAARPPNLDDLFGGEDLCTCASCLSVLSPAAYFVDLLQFCDVPGPGTPPTHLTILLDRRPDLAHIQLTCDNTNTRIPYVDLVNEILASYVAHELPFAYNDPKDGVVSGSADELRVNPISLTDAAADAARLAYKKLQGAVFPFNLPYHHWLDVTRLFLGHFDITRESLMRRFQIDNDLDTEMAIAAETLHLSPQEFEVVTAAKFTGASSTLAPTLESLYGFVETAAAGTAPANHVSPEFVVKDRRSASLKALQNFLKNISTSPGLTPAIRAAIPVDGDFSAPPLMVPTLNAVQAFRTDHALPAAGGTDAAFWGALDAEGHRPLSVLMSHVPMFLRQTGISYDDLVGLVTSKTFNPQFNERVYFSKIGITPEEIMAFVQSGLATLPPAMQAKVTAAGIATNVFMKKLAEFHSVLVLDSPPNALCDVDQTTIRHIDGSLLTKEELLRLQQWIRLWKKLGWTLHEADLAVSLFPLSDPLTLILRLADMTALLWDMNIPVEQLLALWAPIDTWDERSLFERLFRSKTAQSLDPSFALDDFRREIDEFVKNPGTPPLLKDHAPLLLAAFRISAAELALLLPTLPDANLTLRNISALYRQVVLARALDLSPADLLVLQELSGIDALVTPIGQIESAATGFVRIARALQASGFTVPRLDYLLRHRRGGEAGDLLTASQQRDVIGTIHAGLGDIQREYGVTDDPDGDTLVRQLGAVVQPAVSETLARTIYGSFIYSQRLPDFPEGVAFPAAVANKLRYDADRQELRFAGVMIATELGALTALVFVNTLPATIRAPFTTAVKQLFDMPEAFVDRMLFDLMDAGALIALLRGTSSLAVDGTIDRPAVAVKVAAVLAQVRHFLSLSLIKRTLSDTFRLDGPAVTTLLQNADVLVDMNLGGASPAIEDFLAMPGGGVHAAYFANPTLASAPAGQRVDAELNLGATTALPAGVGPGPFSVRWTGYLYSPLTEDFTFVLRVRDAVRVWLNEVLVLDAWKAQPETEFLIETKLRKGSLNALRIEHANLSGPLLFRLSWRSPSLDLSVVPADALYTEDRLQTFVAPLVRLEKIALLVKGFRLAAVDVGAVNRLGYFTWNDVPVAEPATPAAVVTLFVRWKALLQFAAVRDQVSRKEGRFAAMLSAATLDEALDRFANVTGASRSDVQQFTDASTRHPFNTTTLTYGEVRPDILDPGWWSRLRESCLAMARVGCSAAQVVEWSTVKDVTRTAPAPPVTNWYAMSLTPAAQLRAEAIGQDLKRLVKAKYEEAAWRAVARTINDALRTRDRDALIGYVLGMPAILDVPCQTADELFEYFLIDVKMDPCMETSRIQQGIATIQLFLQRGLMGLMEADTPPVKASSIDRQLYERMQSYALWHPSREILIHTEKYIRWDLLDRKSEAYRQFERDIRKQDLTQVDDPAVPRGRWAETAFMNFLEKVDEVSKLQICGQYFDQQEHVLHVFGRTQNAPHRFYYRRADQFRGIARQTGVWTAWERLPIDVDSIEDNGSAGEHFFSDNNHGGVHLMPLMWNRRLYLIWPQFRSVPDETLNKTIPPGFDRVNRWEIKLAWSELWNGSWSPKQVSTSTIASPPYVWQSPAKPAASTTKYILPTATVYWTHVTDFEVFGEEVAGHDEPYTVWTPGHLSNELVEGAGIDIGKDDYATLTTETTTQAVVSYLPEPEVHFFTTAEVDGRLLIRPTVRYVARASGKQIDKTRVSLTLKQGDRLTFRDRTRDPVETALASDIRRYNQLGVFMLGRCKVRDVESFSGGSPENYYGFLTPAGSYNSFQDCLRPNPLAKKYFAVEWVEKTLLDRTELSYRVHGHEGVSGFQHRRPFFFQDRNRVYLVTPMRGATKATKPTSSKKAAPVAGPVVPIGKESVLDAATGGKYAVGPEFMFQLHSDPQVCEFIHRLNHDGLFALLATETQQIKDPTPVYFKTEYAPTAYVSTAYPDEGVPTSFEWGEAYAQYRWELFLYAPMRTWSELLKTWQFAEGEAFLKSVADITSRDSSKSLAERVWQFAPFQTADKLRIAETLGLLLYTGTNATLLADKAKVQATIQDWLRDPFNPHLIARRRVSAYMQAVLMDCCRHYLAAADFEFARYTMESIPRALQYLIVVIKIVGANRPAPVRAPGKTATETFHTLKTKGHLSPFSQFSLALGDLETELPFTHSVPTLPGTIGSASSIQTMYFCLPANDEWARIWDTVADRLFKIRHCMNIDGIVQELPLFPEALDARLLVEARARGLDISSVFDDFRAPLPHHEFSVLFEKALRMTEDVRSFAQRFETLIEKNEAESLAQMRVEQEAEWLKDYLRRELAQTIQLQATQREAVEKSRLATQARFDFYSEQLNRGLIEDEKQQRTALQHARAFEVMAQGSEVQANVVSMIPEAHAQGAASGTSFGGPQLGLAARAFGGMFHMQSAQSTHDSTIAALNAQWERRRDEWSLQRELASHDLKKIDVELLAARIQENIATLRMDNHDKTTANTEAVLEAYRRRFFTPDQYSAVAEDLYPDYFALFQLAYQYARQAEACCRFRFGLPNLHIIQFGYWNNARKGLLAGEHLHLALKQLERVYLDADKREYEIKRDVSLATLDPVAFINLRQTGHCEFEIPETFFDGDYPGQFMRRLRTASVTIPCVTGRYTSVNCVLTLLKNKTRISSEPGPAYEEDLTQRDPRFVTTFAASTQSIATSHAQNDNGLFDSESRDGRYLPFRGAGVVSRWSVDLPIETNAIDRNSMTDLLLHLPYTSQPGGERLRAAAWQAREKALKDPAGLPQRRMFTASFESRDGWHRFLHPEATGTGQTLEIELTCESIGTLFKERTIAVSDVDIYLNFQNRNNNAVYRSGPAAIAGTLSHRAGTVTTPAIVRNLNSIDNLTAGTPIGSFPLAFDIKPGVVSTMRLEIPETSVAGIAPSLIEPIPGTAKVRLKADAIDDLWIVVQYSLK